MNLWKKNNFVGKKMYPPVHDKTYLKPISYEAQQNEEKKSSERVGNCLLRDSQQWSDVTLPTLRSSLCGEFWIRNSSFLIKLFCEVGNLWFFRVQLASRRWEWTIL